MRQKAPKATKKSDFYACRCLLLAASTVAEREMSSTAREDKEGILPLLHHVSQLKRALSVADAYCVRANEVAERTRGFCSVIENAIPKLKFIALEFKSTMKILTRIHNMVEEKSVRLRKDSMVSLSCLWLILHKF